MRVRGGCGADPVEAEAACVVGTERAGGGRDGGMMNDVMPNSDEILRKADEKLRKRTIQAHRDEGIKKNGEGRTFQQPAALGFYAAIALARDCYEMGMRDALAAIEAVRGVGAEVGHE